MRMVFGIPHFYRFGSAIYGSGTESREQRLGSLTRAIGFLHANFGSRQVIPVMADWSFRWCNRGETARDVEIHVVTDGKNHLLDEMDSSYKRLFHHVVVNPEESTYLPYYCQYHLADLSADFDIYTQMEDDIVIFDALLLDKIMWFSRVFGEDKILMPRRFEINAGKAFHKVYNDGEIRLQDELPTLEYPDPFTSRIIRFVNTTNPHSGYYTLTQEQFLKMKKSPRFRCFDASFAGPLESGVTLNLMRTFEIYKPSRENANFAELLHSGDRGLTHAIEKVGSNGVL